MSTIKWDLDPAHSEFQFRAKHMIITTVTGKFDHFEASVVTEEDNIEGAQISFSAETASVNTGVAARDNHLRSDDFFNAEKYPKITFISTAIEKVDEENYTLKGDLTIRDVTRPVTLKVEYGGKVKDPYGNQRMGFTIEGKVHRKDFDLKYNALLESGGAVVSDEIKLNCHVEFIHKEG